jgi:hypothetical protein
MRIPVWEAVRLTRRAISPRLAIRMDRSGSVAVDPVVVFVLACRMVRLGWRTAVVPRRARSLEGVDMVGLEESNGTQVKLHGLLEFQC